MQIVDPVATQGIQQSRQTRTEFARYFEFGATGFQGFTLALGELHPSKAFSRVRHADCIVIS
jgi:hypothetical protein